ncbi:MAG: hypothetical protein ABFD50_15695 [Smithella sp.]
MNEETLDEISNGLVRVYQKKRGYRFSIDAILMAHFVCLKFVEWSKHSGFTN